MSLPPLLKHIYNYGTEEVIRRGKKIFHTHGVSILDQDAFLEQIRFRVRNDVYQNYYTVTLQHFEDPKRLKIRCQCPYNLGEICRHEVAALFHLNDMLQAGYVAGKDISYEQKHTVVRMRQPTIPLLKLFSGEINFTKAKDLLGNKPITLLAERGGKVQGTVLDKGAPYVVKIKLNEDRYFDTSCHCTEAAHPLCMHKAAVFLQIVETQQYDKLFGDSNMDRMKNVLLQQYGYKLEDDIRGKFEFVYENGKPFLRVLDSSLQKLVSPPQAATLTPPDPAMVRELTPHQLGVVFMPDKPTFPYVQLAVVKGEANEEKNKFLSNIEFVDLLQSVPKTATDEEQQLLQLTKKFEPQEILRYIKKNIPFGEFYDNAEEVFVAKPEPEVILESWSYLLPKYHALVKRYSHHGLVFLSTSKNLSAASLKPLTLAGTWAKAVVFISRQKSVFEVKLLIELGIEHTPINKVKIWNDALYLKDELLYVVRGEEDLEVIRFFEGRNEIKVNEAQWPEFLKNTVLQWTKWIRVDFDEDLLQQQQATKPTLRLYLEEYERNLVIKPVFLYHGSEVPHGNTNEVIYQSEGQLFITGRNHAEESHYMHLLKNSHSEIRYANERKRFVLADYLVLQNNWLINFTERMAALGVEIVSLSQLSKYKVSAVKPTTELRVSSGIDWLDTQLKVSFGEELVSAEQIKQALLQRQNYVRLKDGTLGILPQEWVSRYGLLLKMAELKDGTLQLKKVHFNIIDNLLSEQNEDHVQIALDKKKEQLLEIVQRGVTESPLPNNLNASLRPYQIDGIRWLLFLKDAGWGGILADDMGLGKTIQALTLFLTIHNTNSEAHLLVVCPTTLLYNWQHEIEKFTPHLRFYLHHGAKRRLSEEVWQTCSIVITTYGTMRSDIKKFKEFNFDVVVLDESQAIKNPQSQVAKAALLLQGNHKIALSGTPLQNNTFDLYAQMNFLNPGMLGSREFFMQQFATPIDKLQEEEAKQDLRKLVYPFILRRTKEQVAQELPQKTETLLYCEMGEEQQKVYDTFRDLYRTQFLGMIEEQGIERSRFHILQGLTKLRQICDAPSILHGETNLTKESVKLDELMRELLDNIGNHKALVFSQFLGMLALIKQKLEEHNIPYAYFDGSSNIVQREKNIQQFQNDEQCKVFLISLKAGGVGLNLTAADYVYIIDPWWNPAVEQQAIDRTHRIGQTKNIFAYKLICKNTIEEKMLILQERKKILAEELVGDDGAALKNLTKEDIAYLLS